MMVENGSIIYNGKQYPFTSIDCKEILTGTTKLIQLVKRLWPRKPYMNDIQ